MAVHEVKLAQFLQKHRDSGDSHWTYAGMSGWHMPVVYLLPFHCKSAGKVALSANTETRSAFLCLRYVGARHGAHTSIYMAIGWPTGFAPFSLSGFSIVLLP